LCRINMLNGGLRSPSAFLVFLYVYRRLPQFEIDAVTDFLRNLLTAEVDKLPTATLLHRFWYYFHRHHISTTEFRVCLQQHHLLNGRCFAITKSYCGSRFGNKPHVQIQHCYHLLTSKTNATTINAMINITQIFDQQRSCFQYYRQRVDVNCAQVLRQCIAARQLRAVKVVRATMMSMGPLLQALPALRIIHLVRHPRSVARSRIKFGSFSYGQYTAHSGTKSRVVAEAFLYCNQVANDIRIRLMLERQFPGRIMFLTYEDIVANPEQRFRDIYELLDEPIPPVTLNKMQTMFDKARQKANTTTNWETFMQSAIDKKIINNCAEFFNLIGIAPDGSPLKNGNTWSVR